MSDDGKTIDRIRCAEKDGCTGEASYGTLQEAASAALNTED